LEDVVASAVGPSNENEQALANRDLARRITERSPDHLTAPAKLHYLEGLSHEEVGRALGLSRRTVINYLAQFRKRALKVLGRES
jgi:DNA-directed RNA polymerase specialized sigma24 family protein